MCLSSSIPKNLDSPLANKEAIILDPVYTSKGFAALIDYVQKGIIKKGDNVIFIYTGGSPAVFAYNEDINNPK